MVNLRGHRQAAGTGPVLAGGTASSAHEYIKEKKWIIRQEQLEGQLDLANN